MHAEPLPGRPSTIKPGKPVYQSAFRLLCEDRVLMARLDLAIFTNQIKAENASVDKYENELRLLAELPSRPGQIAARVQWLLTKLQVSQTKIEGWEKKKSAS